MAKTTCVESRDMYCLSEQVAWHCCGDNCRVAITGRVIERVMKHVNLIDAIISSRNASSSRETNAEADGDALTSSLDYVIVLSISGRPSKSTESCTRPPQVFLSTDWVEIFHASSRDLE